MWQRAVQKADAFYSVDVTTQVQQWLSGQNDRLQLTSVDGSFSLDAKESQRNVVYLEIVIDSATVSKSAASRSADEIAAAGRKGDKGDKGDRGEAGSPGAQGPQGERDQSGILMVYDIYGQANPTTHLATGALKLHEGKAVVNLMYQSRFSSTTSFVCTTNQVSGHEALRVENSNEIGYEAEPQTPHKVRFRFQTRESVSGSLAEAHDRQILTVVTWIEAGRTTGGTGKREGSEPGHHLRMRSEVRRPGVKQLHNGLDSEFGQQRQTAPLLRLQT